MSTGALAHVIEGIKPGVKVFDLCVRGDFFVEECVPQLHLCRLQPFDAPAGCANRETGKSFNKAKAKDGEKVKKSSAFPTCISLNKCVACRGTCRAAGTDSSRVVATAACATGAAARGMRPRWPRVTG